ncbi:MAG: hypothetical protein ACFE95_08515 [Candidatus Hodarchaeota archaeon]
MTNKRYFVFVNCNHIFNSYNIQTRITIVPQMLDLINASSAVKGIINCFNLKLYENLSYLLSIKMNNWPMGLILTYFRNEQKQIVFGYDIMIIKVDSSIIFLSSLTEFN